MAEVSQEKWKLGASGRANVKTLLMAQVLFRHGDRTPITDYKNNPYKDYVKIYGVKGLGQLTRIGQKEEVRLGVYLRQRYDGFLSRDYSYEDIYCQSSDLDRTIMSAMSLLQGLYPPRANANAANGICENDDWQPIPVHVISKSIDNKLAFKKPCCKFAQLYAEFLKSPKMATLDKENEKLYQYLEKVTGEKVDFFEKVYHIYDTLFINKLYNLPLPEWTSSSGDGDLMEKMKPIANLIFEAYTANEDMKHLFVGPFLEEIISNIDRSVVASENCPGESGNDDEDLPRAKMYLYSGHDTTISSLLNALDVYDGTPPPYSSALMMEVHKLGESAVEVKFFYRPDQTDETFELILPKCGTPCTLDKFKATYADYWKTSNGWDAECEVKAQCNGNTN